MLAYVLYQAVQPSKKRSLKKKQKKKKAMENKLTTPGLLFAVILFFDKNNLYKN